jgi:hypothetical protein
MAFYACQVSIRLFLLHSAVDQARKNGKSEAEIANTRATMEAMTKNAENPMWVAATTFIEPFPVGLLIALASAGVLRRKRDSRDARTAESTA